MSDMPDVFDTAIKHLLIATFPDVNASISGNDLFAQFTRNIKSVSSDTKHEVLSRITDLMLFQQRSPEKRDKSVQLQEFDVLLKTVRDQPEGTEKDRRGEARIVCAANKLSDGTLLLGARHWDPQMGAQLRTWLKAKGMTEDDWIKREGRLEEEQGFIDQYGTFYNRADAYKVADVRGQIIYSIGYKGTDLFSEHLY